MIYDERGGMVAVYEADEPLNCLDLPANSFVYVRHFLRDTRGRFIRDDAACAMAKRIADADRLLELATKHAAEGWALANTRTKQWKDAELQVAEMREVVEAARNHVGQNVNRPEVFLPGDTMKHRLAKALKALAKRDLKSELK